MFGKNPSKVEPCKDDIDKLSKDLVCYITDKVSHVK